jgi:hypothetical protein
MIKKKQSLVPNAQAKGLHAFNNTSLPGNDTTVCHSVTRLSYDCIIPGQQHPFEKKNILKTSILHYR